MSGALDPKIQQEIIDRDLYATAVLSATATLTAASTLRQAGLPGLAAAGGRLRHRRHRAL